MCRLWCCVWLSALCSLETLTFFNFIFLLWCDQTPGLSKKCVCVCMCVRKDENVRVGEEKGHTNMPGAQGHFPFKISKHFLFCGVTFCPLRLFFVLISSHLFDIRCPNHPDHIWGHILSIFCIVLEHLHIQKML